MRVGWGAALAVLCVAGCSESWKRAGGPEGARPIEDPKSTMRATPPELPKVVADPPDAGQPVVPPEKPDVFQPGFHQALRWSEEVGALTTFRMKVPIGRTGTRVRFVLRSGEGPLSIARASVMRSGEAPVALLFADAPSATLGAREAVLSDPLSFPVVFGDELYVSFEVEGHLAASGIETFPGSFREEGAHAMAPELTGAEWSKGVGLTTIEVEGPKRPAFVAVGDSITEGYVGGVDDYRRAWPGVAQQLLQYPFANAGVSGQGLEAALENLEGDATSLPNLTDCVLLIGTNDLHGRDVAWISGKMNELIQGLQPYCRVWAGTLLPKERSSNGVLEEIQQKRVAVNEWIRQHPSVAGVVDFEAFTRSPEDLHKFLEGLGGDGIHPSAQGQQVIGTEVARFFEAQPLQQ